MAKNIELKDEITLDEYKAWLTALLRGKGTKLPDLNDWKAIKKMTDKVVPDIIETIPWTIPPMHTPPATFDTPSPNWWENHPICIGAGNIGNTDNITISNGSIDINLDAAGNMDVNTSFGFSAEHKAIFKSSHTHEYDTSKYIIVSTPSGLSLNLNPANYYIESATKEDLAQIAKIIGVEK